MINFITGFPYAGLDSLVHTLNQDQRIFYLQGVNLVKILSVISNQNKYQDELAQQVCQLFSKKDQLVVDINDEWVNSTAIEIIKKDLKCELRGVVIVRDIASCIAAACKENGAENINEFLYTTGFVQSLKKAYQQLLVALEKHKDIFCIITHDELVEKPQETVEKIYEFFGIKSFAHQFQLDPKETHLDARKILGKRFDEFNQPRFWMGETLESMPKKPLDLQLEASRRGDFQKAWEISELLANTEPDNNRAAYNRGTYVLMQGRLQEGMQLLARGRLEQVFGNSKPNVPTPIWQGEPNQIVLLYLEGGLGDQIHQMRFVQDITARKCRVIVACSPELVTLFATIPNVYAVIVHEAAPGIFHTAWVPGMSAPIPLGIEYKDVWGRAYIPRPQVTKGKFRIGLRWQGNPNFEHDHRKYFPPELLFNAVKGFDVEFVSLQRDEGAQHRPEWIAESKLDSWQDTQLAVAGCDLVISSCTSVAHLSAAMGVPTWVAIPILPYYLWALPGSSVPWYDAVRLFRQSKYDAWEDVFESIRAALGGYLNGVQHGRIKSVG